MALTVFAPGINVVNYSSKTLFQFLLLLIAQIIGAASSICPAVAGEECCGRVERGSSIFTHMLMYIHDMYMCINL